MKMTDIGWINPLKNTNIWWITHYRPYWDAPGWGSGGTTGTTGTLQHRPFSTTHSAPPIHSHSGSAASAVACRYRHRQLAAANQSLTLAARWRFQLPFIIVPWRLISLFASTIPSTFIHYFPHFHKCISRMK